MASDAINTRMKERYEDRTRYFLPRRTYTILRVDGKAFHSYCRTMQRPYDLQFMYDMNKTAELMMAEIMGAQIAYTQSDEISILMTDFAKPSTEAFFDGNIQKIASVSAAMATGFFQSLRGQAGMPLFDARVFTIPDHIEVENYFIGRQHDAVRNSILMLGQHHYSHKELHGKDCSQVQEMIFAKGDNWNSHPDRYKRGGLVYYDSETKPYPSWKHVPAPTFESPEGRTLVKTLIPIHWPEDATDEKKSA